MATRKKKVIITGVSREAADEAFATYAKSDAQVQKINADIELQCAKIREKYADKLATLTSEKEQAFDTLQAFATEHEEEFFSKKKSLDLLASPTYPRKSPSEKTFASLRPRECTPDTE